MQTAECTFCGPYQMPIMPFSRVLAIVIMTLTCSACASRVAVQTPEDFQQFSAATQRGKQIAKLSDFLRRHGVDHVVPIHELLQQGTDWTRNRQQRYSIPDENFWPNMVATLKLLDRFVIPAVGPVKVLSGFRSPSYNLAAGGAPRSRHLNFSALDVIPKLNLTRNTLHNQLDKIWSIHGGQLNMGLGLYGEKRFHIDTGGYRRWRG